MLKGICFNNILSLMVQTIFSKHFYLYLNFWWIILNEHNMIIAHFLMFSNDHHKRLISITTLRKINIPSMNVHYVWQYFQISSHDFLISYTFKSLHSKNIEKNQCIVELKNTSSDVILICYKVGKTVATVIFSVWNLDNTTTIIITLEKA